MKSPRTPAAVKLPGPVWAGGRRPLQSVIAAIATALALGAPPATHAAYETPAPTAQATAARATFLTTVSATSADPPIVCIVDSGINSNADTDASLVGATSVYGGATTGVTDHGTEMAMTAVAPVNGFGMVGAWPAGKLYMVRAMQVSETTFASSAIYQGIDACRRAKVDDGLNIAVVSLSLGTASIPPAGGVIEQLTANAIQQTRAAGINVVAAAGNRSSSKVDFPANMPGVLTIAASDASGAACGLASSGPEVELWTLGCGVSSFHFLTQGAGVGMGSSFSTAFVAGVIAALRDQLPALTPDNVDEILTDNTTVGAAGPTLDVAKAFRAAGLDELVDTHTPSTQPPPSGGGGGGDGGSTGPEQKDERDSAPSPTPSALVAPIPAAPGPTTLVAPGTPEISREQRERATCREAGGWCSAPRLAGAERRGGQLVLQLVAVPKRASVIVRVDGERALVSKPQRSKRKATRGRLVDRTMFRVQVSSSYQMLSIQYMEARRGKSLTLRLRQAELER